MSERNPRGVCPTCRRLIAIKNGLIAWHGHRPSHGLPDPCIGTWGPPLATVAALPCPTCSGPCRETVGMVCQTCGADYAAPVTAVSPGSGDLRDQLAAALWEHLPVSPRLCLCGWATEPPFVGGDMSKHQADAVLPIVEAATARARTEGAAEALQDAADDMRAEADEFAGDEFYRGHATANWLDDRARRAEALRPGEPT